MSVLTRIVRKSRLLLQGRASCFCLVDSLTHDKCGLEIGGPTDLFRGWRSPSRWHWLFAPLPIYDRVKTLDNCNFSSETVWGLHNQEYRFSRRRPPGKIFIAEGTNLSAVPDAAYDFVLSSHNLEHFANPIKALLEWKRVTQPKGALILVLPYYLQTFDHRRQPTLLAHLVGDYERQTGEEDTTHLTEVLQLHDQAMDGFLKERTGKELQERCETNLSNRMMHHHVFDEKNSVELLEYVGLEVLAVERALPFHLILVARWQANE